MKITVNNTEYIANKDNHGWELKIPVQGKDKDGNPKTHLKKLYYGKVGQVMAEIANDQAGKCEDINQIISVLNEIKQIEL